MLIPPASMPGWKIWTVGDDIAWLHPGPDGRLWAINPEAGYFGVVPGTNEQTNRHAYEMIRRDTIFTNVALTRNNEPWWEGLDEGQPVFDWQGRPTIRRRARPRTRIRVSPCRRSRTRAIHRRPTRRPACRSRHSSSAGVAGPWRPWCIRRATGRMACWSVPAWLPRRRLPRPARRRRAPRPDGDEAFRRLQLRRLLEALVVDRPPREEAAGDLPRQLVPSRRRRDASCGRATARTCACSPGSSTAARARPRRVDTAIGAVPTPDALDFSGLAHRRSHDCGAAGSGQRFLATGSGRDRQVPRELRRPTSACAARRGQPPEVSTLLNARLA